MIRSINVDKVTKSIKEMCIEANHYLAPDMEKRLKEAAGGEESPLGRQILSQLEENLLWLDGELKKLEGMQMRHRTIEKSDR